MNPETGQIHPPAEVVAMSRAERRRLESIPAGMLNAVTEMDVDQRKAWAAARIKKRKAARRARRKNR